MKTTLRQKITTALRSSDVNIRLGFLGMVVGVVSGFAAIGLNLGLEYFSGLADQHDAGILVILFPPAGIIMTVFVLKYVLRDFDSHGIPEVIYSISMKGGKLRLRSSISRLIGSLLTISSGGSAGPEAPIVSSGASIGSNVARLLKADEKMRIAVTGAGAAGAIAAIFNAPLTGIIFTMEVIIGEWTSVFMLPVVIASVTGTEISRLFHGNQIPFPKTAFTITLNDILFSLALSLLVALVSILFIRLMRAGYRLSESFPMPDLARAALGGLGVGLIIFMIPEVKGEGYTLIRSLLSGEFDGGVRVVAFIIIFKIIATSLTLSSGGAGGIFAPSLVIGSASGVLFYQLIVLFFPSVTLSSQALFALTGMAGVISGTLAAPLTGMFLVIEITSGYDAILPLLLVSFVSSSTVRLIERHSIYHKDLVARGHLHRPRTDGKILADIRIEELLEEGLIAVSPEKLLREMIPLIKKSNRNHFPVIDSKTGLFLGMIGFNDIKEYIFTPEMASAVLVEDVMEKNCLTVSPMESLTSIQSKFEKSHLWSLPVVRDGKFLGLISKATMLDLYRKELKVQTDR